MDSARKIMDRRAAAARVESWRQAGEKVVFTNGCFDLIHLGHVDYLEKARAMGARLVVGLNTDASVERLKGKGRPVADFHSRSRVLAAMEFVDLVVPFDEDTPYNLIDSIMPDILVKGNDYLSENIVGADIVEKNNGEVRTIPLVGGYSTSELVDKIRKQNK